MQARIREAGAGVIDLDHLLLLAEHFHALPADVEIIELEPVQTSGEYLSLRAALVLAEVVGQLRREIVLWASERRGYDDTSSYSA